ncbi:MAG: Gfo/Idh/MocA family oxidoreductase [Bacteroidales bacterium]|nr:Gfo/Idh/MocA family oxidoreductase [Bacteroidales bacterium]
MDKSYQFNCKAYSSYEEMVEDESIDAIIIGSIDPYHFQQIIKGLNAGKHLLVEKPMVTKLDQIDEIEKLSNITGKEVFPGHNFVYKGALQKAKEIIVSGLLGAIIHSSIIESYSISENHQKGWRTDKKLASGGALMDSGHHLIYQSIFLFGMPVALQAFSSNIILKHISAEDTAQINMQYADGSACSIMQSWASNHGQGINGIRILGNRGNLVITDALYVNGERLNDDVDYGNSFKNQAKVFIETIENRCEPLSNLCDARNTLKIIIEAYNSIINKKVVIFC